MQRRMDRWMHGWIGWIHPCACVRACMRVCVRLQCAGLHLRYRVSIPADDERRRRPRQRRRRRRRQGWRIMSDGKHGSTPALGRTPASTGVASRSPTMLYDPKHRGILQSSLRRNCGCRNGPIGGPLLRWPHDDATLLWLCCCITLLWLRGRAMMLSDALLRCCAMVLYDAVICRALPWRYFRVSH